MFRLCCHCVLCRYNLNSPVWSSCVMQFICLDYSEHSQISHIRRVSHRNCCDWVWCVCLCVGVCVCKCWCECKAEFNSVPWASFLCVICCYSALQQETVELNKSYGWAQIGLRASTMRLDLIWNVSFYVYGIYICMCVCVFGLLVLAALVAQLILATQLAPISSVSKLRQLNFW